MGKLTTWFALLLAVMLAQVAPGAYELGGAADEGMRWVTFEFTPELPVNRVVVAGSFNQWSQIAHPMTDPDGDGTYSTLVALQPGEYEYKFVLNGETWIPDPDNPEAQEPFENSILLVTPATPGTQRGDAPSTEPVPVRIEYRAPGVDRMTIIWGLNGWVGPSDKLMPEGSNRLGENAAETPLRQTAPGRFVLELTIPRGSTMDYVFHLLEPNEQWDNNGGDGIDYHERIDEATVLRHSGSPAPQAEGLIGIARNEYGMDIDGPPRLGAGMLTTTLFCALTGLLIGIGLLLKSRDGVALVGWRRLLIVGWIGLLAFSVRYDHMVSNEYEIDEFAYVPIAMTFAHAMAAGDYSAWVYEQRTTEHPRLGVELYAIAIRAGNGLQDWDKAFYASRLVAVILAMFTAMAIAWRWPLGGVLWASSGLGVFYTSIAYLDSPAAFFAVVCVLGFVAAREGVERNTGKRWVPWVWLGISALGAGMAVSTKYLAAVAPMGVAVGMVVWLVQDAKRRKWLVPIFIGYVVGALVVMVATDAHLWTSDLVSRIAGRFQFHNEFSHSELVVDAEYQWYQPIVWMWYFMGYEGRPFWMLIDQSILVFGLAGCVLAMRRLPVIAVTGWITLIFLFLWPTKWPQYEVVLLPWLCIGAEETLRRACVWVRERSGPRNAPVET
ncbi:hypothetical protein KQI84_04890 [bacterium]|nr:hypothetical protein [bacterium]